MSEVENQKAWLKEFQNVGEWATKLQEFLGSEEPLGSLFPKHFGPGDLFTPTKGDDGKCRVFRAFEALRNPADVQYLVIGQDPYPDESLATGVAFLVPNGKTSPSLEPLKGKLFPKAEGDVLQEWTTSQGMLLLNAALTFSKDRDLDERLDDWKKFTVAVIQFLRKTNPDMEIIALGVHAGNAAKQALIGCCYHPSAVTRSGKRSTITKDFETFWKRHGPLREK